MAVPGAKFHLIFASDSRGREFPKLGNHVNEGSYQSHYIVIPGGRISRINRELQKVLLGIPYEDIAIIKIAAGINDCTEKEVHAFGTQVVPRSNVTALEELLALKSDVQKRHRRSIIGFATIAPVSFKKCVDHYIAKGILGGSKYTFNELWHQQNVHFDVVEGINEGLKVENDHAQVLHPNDWKEVDTVGIKIEHLYWHSDVLKEAIRYGKGVNSSRVRSSRRRIPQNALPDGIHQNSALSAKWSQNLHEVAKKEVDKMRNLLSSSNRV